MSSPRTAYLICYDVAVDGPAGPRRLATLRRQLVAVATPVQYSVFHGSFTRAGLDAILSALGQSIDPLRDDVRLYPVPTYRRIESLGRSILPDGVLAAMAMDICDPEP